MLKFINSFIQRGFTATFSYHSWQVSSKDFRRLVDISLIVIFTLLTLSLFI